MFTHTTFWIDLVGCTAKSIAAIFVCILCLTQEGYGQVPDSAQQVYWQECHAKINALAPNHTGVTDLGNTYLLFAVKYSKDWLFIVSDSLNYDSYFKFNKQDTLRQNSLFFDNNLCRLVEEYLEPAAKPKETVFGELVLKEYYEVKQEGRKFYEQIVKTETGKNYPGFFGKVAKVAFLPIDKLFGIEKMADMKKAVEAQKKAIEDKAKEVQDIKKQTEILKETLEAQQKENEALKAQLAAYEQPEWEEEPLTTQDTNLAIKPDSSNLEGKNNVVIKENTFIVTADTTQDFTDIATLPMDSLKKIKPFNDAEKSQNIDTTDTNAKQVKDNNHNHQTPADSTLSKTAPPADSLQKDNSLEAQKAELQAKIDQKTKGQGAQIVLQLPNDIEADKKRRDQVLEEKRQLSEAIDGNDNPQKARAMTERLKSLDEELMLLLERIGKRLKEEKEKLEQEKNQRNP